jgi:hypothetical protein
MRVQRGQVFAFLLLVAITTACSSSSSRIGHLYASLQADVAERRPGALPDPKLEERHAARAAEVRQIVAKGELKTAKERFEAAVLLVEMDDAEDLKLAEVLAQQAAAEGERLGPRVAAEAIDKQLVLRHLPQRYGTQYEWVAVLGEWRLYPLDPKTTDSERQAVGVPPLTELYEGEKRMNAARGGH